MNKRWFHILLLVSLLALSGCVDEIGPKVMEEEGITLTIRCEDPLLTKASPPDGEQQYNENLIKSVDFFFYPGETPDATQAAVFHIRKEQATESEHDGEANFKIVLKKSQFGNIFDAQYHKSTVYALVNFDEAFINKSAGLPSMQTLAQKVATTDFLQETDFVQSAFLMDGKTVITYDPDHPEQAVNGTIEATRFAVKLTMGVNVTPSVTLHHYSPDPDHPVPDEVWTPVLHTMRLYLVDGVNTVQLGHVLDDGTTTLPYDQARVDSPEETAYFTYKNNQIDHSRPFLRDDNTPYVGTTTIEETTYYDTYPMYTYPRTWSVDKTTYVTDYSSGMPHEAPYFKLEMDWRRQEDENYSYDRRKYYYKIFLPLDIVNKLQHFDRNHWYAFFLDVSILGSETDEGKATITPSCYVLDWQNRALAINKAAVISKARYLSVEKDTVWINNLNEVSIPFISSHNVHVVQSSVKATRPYYGTDTSEPLPKYIPKLHAWVTKDPNDGRFYLQFQGQPAKDDPVVSGISNYDPKKHEPYYWLTNTSTTVKLNHPLVNNYALDDFDYSPYTIDFDIVHNDLDEGTDRYDQYKRHVTIIQYPAIYIEATRNSDNQIQRKYWTDQANDKAVYWYGNEEGPPYDGPWGYVYIDNGRFIRYNEKENNSNDPYTRVKGNNANKKEYQWRTVWYTGGSRDIFKINVTVLPSSSLFTIGDPRMDAPDNLNYTFTNLDNSTKDILPTRVGFTPAKVVDEKGEFVRGENGEPIQRKLTYYYPTDGGPRTEYMLAPSYRISSKFGGTEYGGLEKKYAEYRCAAYQEDGFPAGRWRLPTRGEVLFIAQLSAKGAFERLFEKTTYWSAHGAITVGNGTVSNSNATTALLRCVYDSWYWGDLQHDPRDEFVWGDRKKYETD